MIEKFTALAANSFMKIQFQNSIKKKGAVPVGRAPDFGGKAEELLLGVGRELLRVGPHLVAIGKLYAVGDTRFVGAIAVDEDLRLLPRPDVVSVLGAKDDLRSDVVLRLRCLHMYSSYKVLDYHDSLVARVINLLKPRLNKLMISNVSILCHKSQETASFVTIFLLQGKRDRKCL